MTQLIPTNKVELTKNPQEEQISKAYDKNKKVIAVAYVHMNDTIWLQLYGKHLWSSIYCFPWLSGILSEGVL